LFANRRARPHPSGVDKGQSEAVQASALEAPARQSMPSHARRFRRNETSDQRGPFHTSMDGWNFRKYQLRLCPARRRWRAVHRTQRHALKVDMISEIPGSRHNPPRLCCGQESQSGWRRTEPNPTGVRMRV
jgi:hypothetical protein